MNSGFCIGSSCLGVAVEVLEGVVVVVVVADGFGACGGGTVVPFEYDALLVGPDELDAEELGVEEDNEFEEFDEEVAADGAVGAGVTDGVEDPPPLELDESDRWRFGLSSDGGARRFSPTCG